MPTFWIKERGISYWSGGRVLSKERETILFIHGAGGSHLSWGLQKGFFEREFNPILIDLPGHGESGGTGEEEIRRYADHVCSFLEALDLRQSFLVGHSMGGAIVQTLAVSRPEMIRGIVLAGTGARLRVMPAVLNGIKNDFEETIRKIVRFAFSRKAPREIIEAGIEFLMKCQPQVLYGDFLACDRFDLMKEVSRIHLPTLILCGGEDEMTPAKYSEFLHHQIQSSELEVLPDAGHMMMMESPEAFNRKIREFVLRTAA